MLQPTSRPSFNASSFAVSIASSLDTYKYILALNSVMHERWLKVWLLVEHQRTENSEKLLSIYKMNELSIDREPSFLSLWFYNKLKGPGESQELRSPPLNGVGTLISALTRQATFRSRCSPFLFGWRRRGSLNRIQGIGISLACKYFDWERKRWI